MLPESHSIRTENNAELFTIGIVCYRNWEHLTQTIDSVLMQDYPAIQLIVSDDGSQGFPEEWFNQYIEEHKGDNIRQFLVRHSEKNEGTVRHLNHVLEYSKGAFFMAMAADDAFDNESVFSRFVEVFEREGPDCGVVMAQTLMYDAELSARRGFFVWPEVEKAINRENSSDELLKQLFFVPCLPTTSLCCRREIMERFGPFDTDYKLIEDWPFHLKLAQANVRMRYENFVAARHRDGGISHGAVNALSDSKRMYYEDCVRARKTVISMMKKEDVGSFAYTFSRWQIIELEKMLITTETGWKGFLRYAARHPLSALTVLSHSVPEPNFYKWLTILFLGITFLFSAQNLSNAIAAAFALPSAAPIISAATIFGLVYMIAASIACFLHYFFFWLQETDRFPIELIEDN